MEIKVKIWDKKLNVMWQGIELKRLLRYSIFQICPNSTAYGELKDHFDEMVWLQFTGLKDKNGKEIYEGDIVRGRLKQVVTVIWNEAYARFSTKPTWSDGLPMYIEVIGNIYENPELLTKEV